MRKRERQEYNPVIFLLGSLVLIYDSHHIGYIFSMQNAGITLILTAFDTVHKSVLSMMHPCAKALEKQ